MTKSCVMCFSFCEVHIFPVRRDEQALVRQHEGVHGPKGGAHLKEEAGRGRRKQWKLQQRGWAAQEDEKELKDDNNKVHVGIREKCVYFLLNKGYCCERLSAAESLIPNFLPCHKIKLFVSDASFFFIVVGNKSWKVAACAAFRRRHFTLPA